MSSRTPSEENVIIDVIKESLSVQNSHSKIHSTLTSIKNEVSGTDQDENKPMKRNNAFVEKNKDFPDVPVAPEGEFIFNVPKNYLMSPYLAPDELLRQFPKTNILTTIVDPCCDDSTQFAKKLRDLKVDLKLDILGALNHGFLNFAGVC